MVKKVNHNGKEITFDDLEYQSLDGVDHTVIYECRGYDERGNTYTGIIDKTCDKYGDIEFIEVLLHARIKEKKPYQARVLLKSVRYWQAVVNGAIEPKKPMAYYQNRLKFYTDGDIAEMERIAATSAVKTNGQAFNFDNDPPVI